MCAVSLLRNLILVILIAFFSVTALAFVKKDYLLDPAKIWNQPGKDKQLQIDGYNAVGVDSMSNHAGPYDFHVNSYDKKYNIYVEFHGKCMPIVKLKVTLTEPQLISSYKKFLTSRQGKDLPLMGPLTAVKAMLVDQCEDLEMIQVVLHSNFSHQQVPLYRGTMVASNYWQLDDGNVSIEHENILGIEFNVVPVNGVGVRHRGHCEFHPTLHLYRHYENDAERTFPKAITIDHYAQAAQDITNRYQQRCPEVDKITYTITPIPIKYRCIKNNIELCVLTTSSVNNWKVNSSAFEPKAYHDGLVSNFRDIIYYLNRGDFKTLQASVLFRLFYEEYLKVYSQYCGTYIQDPIVREIILQEDSGNSRNTFSKEAKSTEKIYIEQRYIDRFDSYYAGNQVTRKQYIISRILNFKKQDDYGIDAALSAVNFFAVNRGYIEEHIKNACSDNKVKRVYENLYRMAHRQSALLSLDLTSLNTGVDIKLQQGEQKSELLVKPEEQHPHNVGAEYLAGLWSAVIDGYQIELKLWKTPSEALVGYIYSPAHNCFLQAVVSVNGQFIFKRDRLNHRNKNCKSSNSQEFVGFGSTNFNGNIDKVNVHFSVKVFGNPATASGQANIVFTRKLTRMSDAMTAFLQRGHGYIPAAYLPPSE